MLLYQRVVSSLERCLLVQDPFALFSARPIIVSSAEDRRWRKGPRRTGEVGRLLWEELDTRWRVEKESDEYRATTKGGGEELEKRTNGSESEH